MIVLMSECCEECKDDPCAPCEDDGCVDSPGSYLFTTVTRYWMGPNSLYNGEPISTGDRVDTTVYSPPGEINGVYKFSTVTVQTYVGFEPENDEDEPEAVEHDGSGDLYDNYYGCMPDPDNPNKRIKFQQPGTHIMNGYLTEADIQDGVTTVDTFWKLVVS